MEEQRALWERGSVGDGAKPQDRPARRGRRLPGLKPAESFAALVILAFWLLLFAGGILVDTKPHRYWISPGGVHALDAQAASTGTQAPYVPSVAEEESKPHLLVSWLVVLLWFLPVNLALLCAAAGALGAFGNRANLHHEQEKRPPRDESNPYLSAVLRGFFVYLFLISGLLLIDETPFSAATPGQYVRLAGFLSLFSFVVNYSPNVFSSLISWAFNRIQARGGEEAAPEPPSREIAYARASTVEVAMVNAPPSKPDDAGEAASAALAAAVDPERADGQAERVDS